MNLLKQMTKSPASNFAGLFCFVQSKRFRLEPVKSAIERRATPK
jgi:hypothetical protein